jgi:hypothetical protein
MIETANGKINLAKELFWDIPEKNIPLALNRSSEWVVVRVFEYGTLEEIAEIIKFYGKEKIKELLLKFNLRPMAKAMARLFLDVEIPANEERSFFYR